MTLNAKMEDNTKKSESKPGHKKKMVSTKKDKNSRGVGDNLGPRAVQPTMTDLPTGNDDFEASSSLQQFVSVDSDYNSYPGHRTRRARQMDERQNREMLSPGNGIPEWPRSFRASPTPSSVPSTNTARQGSVYSDRLVEPNESRSFRFHR